MKLSAEQAAAYSIHGLKHFIITAATQLDIDRTAIVKLGHWHSNSEMPDKYNQSKCVRELTTRAAIQKQFVAGWRPVGGSELANEWIQFEEDFEQTAGTRKSPKPPMRPPKSVTCKFPEAKRKIGGTKPPLPRMDEATKLESVTKRVKLENCKPELPLEEGKSNQSLKTAKGGIKMRSQEWVQYPESIKNNKIRVVQSDAKTHYFNGVDASYCSSYRCGTVDNVRPGVSFYHKVPEYVTKSGFCIFCREHKEKIGGWQKGLRGIKRPTLPPINH